MKKTLEKMHVKLLEIKRLKQHEKISHRHMLEIKEKIETSGVFKEPIIVDKENLVVLDGHHRLNSCISLGLKKIPCILVDYIRDKSIRVKSRRKGFEITKEKVVETAKNNRLFPKKTTKHFIPQRIKNMKLPLEKLA